MLSGVKEIDFPEEGPGLVDFWRTNDRDNLRKLIHEEGFKGDPRIIDVFFDVMDKIKSELIFIGAYNQLCDDSTMLESFFAKEGIQSNFRLESDRVPEEMAVSQEDASQNAPELPQETECFDQTPPDLEEVPLPAPVAAPVRYEPTTIFGRKCQTIQKMFSIRSSKGSQKHEDSLRDSLNRLSIAKASDEEIIKDLIPLLETCRKNNFYNLNLFDIVDTLSASNNPDIMMEAANALTDLLVSYQPPQKSSGVKHRSGQETGAAAKKSRDELAKRKGQFKNCLENLKKFYDLPSSKKRSNSFNKIIQDLLNQKKISRYLDPQSVKTFQETFEYLHFSQPLRTNLHEKSGINLLENTRSFLAYCDDVSKKDQAQPLIAEVIDLINLQLEKKDQNSLSLWTTLVDLHNFEVKHLTTTNRDSVANHLEALIKTSIRFVYYYPEKLNELTERINTFNSSYLLLGLLNPKFVAGLKEWLLMTSFLNTLFQKKIDNRFKNIFLEMLKPILDAKILPRNDPCFILIDLFINLECSKSVKSQDIPDANNLIQMLKESDWLEAMPEALAQKSQMELGICDANLKRVANIRFAIESYERIEKIYSDVDENVRFDLSADKIRKNLVFKEYHRLLKEFIPLFITQWPAHLTIFEKMIDRCGFHTILNQASLPLSDTMQIHNQRIILNFYEILRNIISLERSSSTISVNPLLMMNLWKFTEDCFAYYTKYEIIDQTYLRSEDELKLDEALLGMACIWELWLRSEEPLVEKMPEKVRFFFKVYHQKNTTPQK